MAKSKRKWNAFTKATIGKEALDKIGTYQEAPGGGTPVKGGGRGAMDKNFKVVDSKEEADKIRETDPNAKIRYNQPRDENGQFTYNSSNAKELVTGPSRGYTIPPFLRGVNIKFAEVGSKIRTKEDGKLKTLLSTVNMSKEALIMACREYVKEEGGFLGMGKDTTIEKKGRASKAEKATKGTGFVEDKEGNRENFDFNKSSASTQQEAAKAQENYKESSAGKYDNVNDAIFSTDNQEYEDYMNEAMNEDSTKMIKGGAKGTELKGQAKELGIDKEVPMAQEKIEENKAKKAALAQAAQAKKAAAPAQEQPKVEKEEPAPTKEEQKPMSEEEQAKKASELLGTEVKPETKEEPKVEQPVEEDVEFNAEEIGDTKESQIAWLKKNKKAIDKIMAKYPNAKYGGIIKVIKSGKVKRLSDLLK